MKSLKALKIETPLTLGKKEKREVTTTTKSSMFHGSLRYVFLERIKPCAIILIAASAVNTTAYIGSVMLRILFPMGALGAVGLP